MPNQYPGTGFGREHFHFRYYDLCLAGFVVVLLCSNIIGPPKVAVILGLSFSAGNIFFPISYIFGDILTEVYGYALSRRAIWAGFGALLFASVMSLAIIHLPVAADEPLNTTTQPALEFLFNRTWRISLASLGAFLVGDFLNSYVLAKMKILTRGRHLWTRTIGSTIVGQAADSAIFYPLAFWGVWSHSTLAAAVIFNWLFKVFIEVIMTPVTYAVVRWLKRKEGVDFFDYGTNFNPFKIDSR
jgi:uncharacterized integral membrane protein (TIGR00697 family)